MSALLWFYLTSLAILFGAQLDATIERGPQEVSEPASAPGHEPDAFATPAASES